MLSDEGVNEIMNLFNGWFHLDLVSSYICNSCGELERAMIEHYKRHVFITKCRGVIGMKGAVKLLLSGTRCVNAYVSLFSIITCSVNKGRLQ
jgi:hypothetical protein